MILRPASVPLALLLCLAALAPGCDKSGPAPGKASSDAARAVDAPTLELYVMSQCPYGVEAEAAVIAARKQLGGNLNVKLAFIGDGEAGALESMHGPNEVKGDLAQICAAKVAPDRFLDLVACQNENPRAVAENWRECATQAGIDAGRVASCVEGDEGQQLLAASFAEARTRGVQGSPTMFLDGKPYEGGRKPRDLVRATCDAWKGQKPAQCTSLPVPPPVHAVFLSDKRCKECDLAELEPRLKGEIGGLMVENVDYSSERGKALYGELRAAGPAFKLLPAVLLDAAELEKDADAVAALARFLVPVGKYRSLAIGGEFDPTAELCDNRADDDGDDAVDCSDSDCKLEKPCREAKPQTLDLFVMSQCPYGAKAMIATQRIVEQFGKELTLNVRFIGDATGGELRSMHGPAEVAEDLRERCAVAKYAADAQFMKYLACRSKDYKSTAWEGCATESGMDPKVLQACVDGEGKDLLKADFVLANGMHIDGSPTFVVNNGREFNAIEPAEIQAEFCRDNPTLKGCKDRIPVDPAASQPGQKGSCN
ncbi:MAG: DsbA family protein [Polyangiaceae bacterium]|nr:DsbA family protein [Polyangiaceae bacterium]